MRVALSTAIALTGLSGRTLRRWIADGTLPRCEGARAEVDLDSLTPHMRLTLDDDSRAVIGAADRGDAGGQNDLAMLFLTAHQHGRAAAWLERAAGHGHADAMHWLARCYLDGRGETLDIPLGVMWLAKSAAQGHRISAMQLTSLVRAPLQKPGHATPEDVALDHACDETDMAQSVQSAR